MARNAKTGLLYRRMRDLGYDNITDFQKHHPELHLSFETIRRAILQDSQIIEYIIVAELMQALEATPQEIAAELERRGDHVIHRLVSDSAEGMILSSREKRIINLLRKYDNPSIYKAVEAIFAIAKGQEKYTEEDPVDNDI